MHITDIYINRLSVNFTEWSNTLKQFVGKLLTNRFSVFDHFVGLALKGLMSVLFFPLLCSPQTDLRIVQ